MEANRHIICSVVNCKHHLMSDNFCSLDRVNIGTHEMNPTKCECTDCNSFEKK